MVRKSQFSREDVVNAAFMVVKKVGIDQLSARNVAHELGASTAPVYSNFENMEKLEEAVFAQAAAKFLDYTQQNHTDNAFLNMGIGVLMFARDCPQWYFAFSSRRQSGQDQMEGIFTSLLDIMADLPDLEPLHPLERKLLLRKMAIFTHGLASEVCAGLSDDQTMKDFITLLEEVGLALAEDARTREPRNEQELERIAVLCHQLPTVNRDLNSNQPKDELNENFDK
jgi:AcrR family transcriptional regulator